MTLSQLPHGGVGGQGRRSRGHGPEQGKGGFCDILCVGVRFPVPNLAYGVDANSTLMKPTCPSTAKTVGAVKGGRLSQGHDG